jgi:GNAT superfamily N-acetyltransferase
VSEAWVTVRRARTEDGPVICEMIEALLEYENIGPMTDGAHERLTADAFAENPRFATFIAETADGIAGYAIVYETYSTLRARPRLFIEDIFVRPEQRGTGAGYALFREAIRYAAERGCAMVEWQVLTWNQPAIDFYERQGAARDREWYTYRLDEDGMRALTGAG